jgi:hypothetical protein
MRCTTADTVFSGGAAKTLDDPRVSSQAQVVVAAKIQVLVSIDTHDRPLRRLKGYATTIQTLLVPLLQSQP